MNQPHPPLEVELSLSFDEVTVLIGAAIECSDSLADDRGRLDGEAYKAARETRAALTQAVGKLLAAPREAGERPSASAGLAGLCVYRRDGGRCWGGAGVVAMPMRRSRPPPTPHSPIGVIFDDFVMICAGFAIGMAVLFFTGAMP
jgi:hypothetical protein